MNQKKNRFIPVLSSEAGACLTLQNWQREGIDIGVYYLEALLTKPGMVLLQTFSNLRAYTAWPGIIILNARLSGVSKTGDYTIRSPYDGRLIRISAQELVDLVKQLQPDLVVWPETLSPELLQGSPVVSLVPGENLLPNGSVFYKIDTLDSEESLVSMPTDSALPIWVESDRAAADALQGIVYQQSGTYNLLEAHFKDDFKPLEEGCECTSCSQGYTRAYLHHLLQHTPLLAQRFLISHNVHYCCYILDVK